MPMDMIFLAESSVMPSEAYCRLMAKIKEQEKLEETEKENESARRTKHVRPRRKRISFRNA
jgi:fido (protein-threonine AMPylation protein)